MEAMSNPGRALNRDISKGESVEAEISAFISRRDTQRRKTEGERPEEAAWVEHERTHNARRTAEMRAAWCEFHRGQAERHRRNLTALVAFHEAEAERLTQATERRTAA